MCGKSNERHHCADDDIDGEDDPKAATRETPPGGEFFGVAVIQPEHASGQTEYDARCTDDHEISEHAAGDHRANCGNTHHAGGSRRTQRALHEETERHQCEEIERNVGNARKTTLRVKQVGGQDAPDIPVCDERGAVVARERDPKTERQLDQVDEDAQRDERLRRARLGCVFADLVDPVHAREALLTVGQALNPRAQRTRKALEGVVVFEISAWKQVDGVACAKPQRLRGHANMGDVPIAGED